MATTLPQDADSIFLEINKKNRPSNPLISCIAPCYNEAANLENLATKIDRIFKGLNLRYELILVNDGSHDQTAAIAHGLLKKFPIKLIQLSRNYGKEIALSAGIDHAQGDCSILIDADLQHPPELITAFYQHWQDGYDMVYGYRASREDESLLKRSFVGFFYGLMNLGQKRKIIPNTLDYRLMDKKVVTAMTSMPENNRFMKGLYSWVGFTNIGLPVEISDRTAGKTSFGFINLLKLALTGLTAFSNVPLRLWGILGAVISLLSFAYGTWVAIETLIWGNPTAGWPTVIVVQAFLGGILLTSIGILGEYIGRIFTEVKRRPLYFVSHVIQSDEQTD
jgi:glycosyltransferase involved in cell wall biosynthesis